jgi:ribonucleoside-triphosphate reductase
MQVKKRDGQIVRFNQSKIMDAISKANKSVEKKERANTNERKEIIKYIKSLKLSEISVEEIQDIIEQKLMELNKFELAKKYILYREERTKIRNRNSQLMKDVAKKINASDVQNQNANVDENSFGGRAGEARDELLKDYALNYIVSDMSRANHINNEIYIHDLSSYAIGMHNCLSIPFDDLLKNGFNTRQTDVRPAQSINTAFQLLAVIFQLQSLQQFGGVSATHLDWTMVPYVRKSFFKHWTDGMKYIENVEEVSGNPEMSITDEYYKGFPKSYQYAMDKTTKELQQAVEGMYHNLNTLQSRSGNQLPFTSINYGTCTLPEGRMVIKALLEGSIKGVGKVHRTPVFPCGIFQCMKGVNRKEGEPNYDLFKLALKSTSQRLYPNYANVDWSGNEGYDKNDPKTYFSTMGCRTANGFDINANPGVNPQTKDGRGNICPVTIIMPTLAMEAGKKVETFMKLLDKKIHEAKDMLIERYNYIISQNPESGRFMYENNVMAGFDGETIESAMKHGTLAIGQLGLAETLRILIDKDQTTNDGMKLAKRIEQLFKDRCSEFKREYKLNFGVYFTPAENLCYTAMKKFQKKYGRIKNISDKDFFTNSMHCSVWKELSPFEKIDIESQLTGYSSARLYNICRIRRDCKK